MTINAIPPIGLGQEAESMTALSPTQPTDASFGSRLLSGVSQLEQQSETAATALASYAVGGDVAPHELMIAMEQAKLSLQFAVEVRNRVVEAYQELARLQV